MTWCRRSLTVDHNDQSLTLMGVYHLDRDEGLYTGAGLGGGRGMMGSSTSSGKVTTAFLGLSSRVPSSVDPFCPQRT